MKVSFVVRFHLPDDVTIKQAREFVEQAVVQGVRNLNVDDPMVVMDTKSVSVVKMKDDR